jgi:hypothetical protein
MKNLNVDQMSEIQGGRASDVMDGICAGVGVVTVLVGFGLALTGIGIALLVSVGGACAVRDMAQRF